MSQEVESTTVSSQEEHSVGQSVMNSLAAPIWRVFDQCATYTGCIPRLLATLLPPGRHTCLRFLLFSRGTPTILVPSFPP